MRTDDCDVYPDTIGQAAKKEQRQGHPVNIYGMDSRKNDVMSKSNSHHMNRSNKIISIQRMSNNSTSKKISHPENNCTEPSNRDKDMDNNITKSNVNNTINT